MVHLLACGCLRNNLELDEDHDAYFCSSCNRWLEDRCPSEDCEMCINRPERPMEK